MDSKKFLDWLFDENGKGWVTVTFENSGGFNVSLCCDDRFDAMLFDDRHGIEYEDFSIDLRKVEEYIYEDGGISKICRLVFSDGSNVEFEYDKQR